MKDYIDIIDCYKRMSPKEHYSLYEFYLMNNDSVSYEKFMITETLVKAYNKLPEKDKITIAKKIHSRPEYIRFENEFNREPWKYDKAVIWEDREKDEYYIENLKKSHAFEVFIDSLFKNRGIDIGLFYSPDLQYRGESDKGIEIKFDEMSKKTGNYYIEYKERINPNSDWVDSGILKNDNTKYWLCGTENKYRIFEKQRLLEIYHKLKRKEKVDGAILVEEGTRKTSKGVVIFPKLQEKICLSIDDLINLLNEA